MQELEKKFAKHGISECQCFMYVAFEGNKWSYIVNDLNTLKGEEVYFLLIQQRSALGTAL